MKPLIAAGLVAVALSATPAANADGPDPNAAPNEVGFLEGLKVTGLEKERNPVFLIAMAYGICKNLRDGQDALQVARSIQADGMWAPHDAWATMTSAAWFICPDMFATYARQLAAAQAAGDTGAPVRRPA